ncbi:MAG: hypothetical protein ACJ8J0_13120 [Longimicrobiaceae bacterium]
MTTLATRSFNAAVAAMVDHLKHFLPPAGNPPRPASLAVLEAAERPVGVGNFQGNVERGALAVLGVRGGRVQARVRYDLRADTPHEAAAAVEELQRQVRAARLDPLLTWIHEFLVLEPDGGEPASPLGQGEGWRQGVEYRVLFEYRYEDLEDAGSLIVRVRVELEGEHHEHDAVTRDLTRWDDTGAPPLRIRGPRAIGPLGALVHPATGLPDGRVTLLRTHDGAAGQPSDHPNLGAFRTAVEGGDRHDRFVFAAPGGLAAFVAEFAGEDANQDGAVDTVTLLDPAGSAVPFEARVLDALAGVRLDGPGERFEVGYLDPALPPLVQEKFPDGSLAVVYLRAGRGRSA